MFYVCVCVCHMLCMGTYLRVGTCDSRVKLIESCLKNGYGLRHFYNFLNIPFLRTKLLHLLAQIKATKVVILYIYIYINPDNLVFSPLLMLTLLTLIQDELQSAAHENEMILEQDYESYLKWLAANAPGGHPNNPNNPNITTLITLYNIWKMYLLQLGIWDIL